jgi:hypothetical protein
MRGTIWYHIRSNGFTGRGGDYSIQLRADSTAFLLQLKLAALATGTRYQDLRITTENYNVTLWFGTIKW